MDTHWEVLRRHVAADPTTGIRHLVVDNILYDSSNKCGAIQVPPGHSALALRNMLAPHLKLRISLNLTVKADLIHPVVAAVAHRAYGRYKEEAFVGGLKAVNKFLNFGLFELIKTAPQGNTVLHYFVTTEEIAKRVTMEPMQNIFGKTTFLKEITYLRASKKDLPSLFLLSQAPPVEGEMPPQPVPETRPDQQSGAPPMDQSAETSSSSGGTSKVVQEESAPGPEEKEVDTQGSEAPPPPQDQEEQDHQSVEDEDDAPESESDSDMDGQDAVE